MFGVVLWSNPDEGKAVIWCEDQGDLAYVEPGGFGSDPLAIEAGDLVELEFSSTSQSRSVESARLVERQAYPSIADKLTGYDKTPHARTGSAEIIKFLPAKKQCACSAPDQIHQKGLAAS